MARGISTGSGDLYELTAIHKLRNNDQGHVAAKLSLALTHELANDQLRLAEALRISHPHIHCAVCRTDIAIQDLFIALIVQPSDQEGNLF